jgi:poly(A) polymerase
MRDQAADLQRSLRSDPLFTRAAAALEGLEPGTCHACGAYVLESMAGAEPGGLLVTTSAPAGEVASRLAGATGLFPTPLKRAQGVYNLSRPGERGVTVIPQNGRDITSHLQGAGFTVLAMAVDFLGEGPRDIIDPLGGLDDLARGVLRAAGQSSIREEPARVMLALDLMRRFGLAPDEETTLALKVGGARAGDIGGPRAWKGLARLLMGSRLSGAAEFLEETGALGAILPEVACIYEVPQNYYHHLDVWRHTLETLDRLEEMLTDPRRHFKAHGERIASYLTRPLEGGVRRRSLLAIAGLIHDVGKASTMTVEPSGRIRFQGHQLEGARLAGGIAARFGLGNRAREHLVAIVRDHMRLGFLLKEGESTATRLCAALDLGGHCVEVVMLSLADRLATRGEASTAEGLERFKRVAMRVLGDWFWLRDFPPLVDGRDIMVHAGMAEGPEVGRALFRVRVAQRESIIASRPQALEFLAPDFKGKMDMRGDGRDAYR